jgi:hypothetical protein
LVIGFVIEIPKWRSTLRIMTIRALTDTARLLPFAFALAATSFAACDKKDDAAPTPAKSGEPAAKSATAADKPATPADKPAAAPAPGVKIVANFEEFNGTYDKSVALVNNIGVEIALARDCPALTCETFTEDGYSMSKDVLLKACPKVYLAQVEVDGAKDLPVGEHKATISLLGVAESATNSMARESDMATIKITERTPQAFVGSISFGTQEEGDSNASGTFSAPICPHKD